MNGPIYGGNLYGRPRMAPARCSTTPVLDEPARSPQELAPAHQRSQETGRWQVEILRGPGGRPVRGYWRVYSPDWTTWRRPIEVVGPMARAVAYAHYRAVGHPHNVADFAARGYVNALRERGIDPR